MVSDDKGNDRIIHLISNDKSTDEDEGEIDGCYIN